MVQTFLPPNLPVKLDISKLATKIGPANRALARYDGFLQSLPNPYLLVSPLFTDEALQSSKIEGTQATLEEVLEFQSNPEKSDNKDNIFEVINYRNTIFKGIELIKQFPISTRLLNQLHPLLLKNSRGNTKKLGSFRQHQVHIGKPGSRIEEASYIPPEPQLIPNLISNWENYVNNYSELDELVKLAITHAQFEMIHPYEDGNGRLGRILFPLFLFQKNIISSPNFFLSGYLESHRDEYYSRLRNISQSNLWEEWILYFLEAIIQQSDLNLKKVERMQRLYNETKINLPPTKHSIKVLDFIVTHPIFDMIKFREETSIPRATALKVVNDLINNGFLKEISKGKGRQSSVFVFNSLIDIIS